ncbi:MAG: hypothetical protein ABSH06_17990 [Thermodesulfobacteriota bacterium]
MEKVKKSFCRICDTCCGIDMFVKDGVLVNVEGMKELQWPFKRDQDDRYRPYVNLIGCQSGPLVTSSARRCEGTSVGLPENRAALINAGIPALAFEGKHGRSRRG